MADVADFDRLVAREHGLSVVSTLRADQTIQATVVNCGVLDHPVRGAPVVGFTTRGNSRKLANLRARPRLAATVRAGWEWVTAEGPHRAGRAGRPARRSGAERPAAAAARGVQRGGRQS